jgi:hypothetical protein
MKHNRTDETIFESLDSAMREFALLKICIRAPIIRSTFANPHLFSDKKGKGIELSAVDLTGIFFEKDCCFSINFPARYFACLRGATKGPITIFPLFGEFL